MIPNKTNDQIAIRELLDTYSDAVILRDKERWAATWTDDATWRFRTREVRGREQIVATWEKAMTGFESVWFMAYPGMIEIDGDTAIVRTHTFEHLAPISGTPKLQAGIYEDRLVRTAEGWRFSERSFQPKELSL